jgi:hypothetical protein
MSWEDWSCTIRLSRNFIQKRQDEVKHRCKDNYQPRSSYFFENTPATAAQSGSRNVNQNPLNYDEQTVNSALLQFLKALTIKLNGIRSRWADYRHRFTQKLARDR